MLRSGAPHQPDAQHACNATARSSRSGRAWRAATSRWRRASRSVGSMAREVMARGLYCARLRPMAAHNEPADHCRELLAPFGAVRVKRMFGGHGFYVDELFHRLLTPSAGFI